MEHTFSFQLPTPISKKMVYNWHTDKKISMCAHTLKNDLIKFLDKNDNNSTTFKKIIVSHFPSKDEFSYEEIKNEDIRREFHDALQKVFIDMDISIKCEEEKGVTNWYVIIDWSLK